MVKKQLKHTPQNQDNKYPKLQIRRDPAAIHHYLKGEIRILTPSEYQKLQSAITQDRHKTLLDVLLITGMRYIEVQRLYEHPEWYIEKENIIHLPEEAMKKAERRQLERTITPLPSMFKYIMKDFHEARRPPDESNWNRGLMRWAIKAGIHPYGISAKTTRKTIESWQVASGIEVTTICLRAGHDNLTSMRHYQGIAFNDEERTAIKKQLTDWGMI
jgi:integrase